MPSLEIIAVPWDSGRRAARMGNGPLHLLDRGLPRRLEDDGHAVRTVVVECDLPFPTEATAAGDLQRRVAGAVRDARGRGAFPLVLAGNCSTSVGTTGALGAGTGIVWLDAHGDFNTPETSPTGFFDGMSLAMATGRCWRPLAARIPGWAPVPDDCVALVGARDLDPGEREALAASGVACVAAREVLERGAAALDPALDRVAAHARRAYLHVDLDVHEPAEVPANGYPVPGGLRAADVRAIAERVAARLEVAAAAITAYDPAVDHDDRVLGAAIELARTIARLARPAAAAVLLLLALLLPRADAGAQPAHQRLLAERFRGTLAEIAAATNGVVGVQVVDLATGERHGVNDTLTFPQGSAIKVAILVELYRRAERGELALTDRLPVREADQVGGSGVLQAFADGASELSLRDLAVLMIVLSDNTATNMLIERVGMERVGATMRDLGVGAIRLQRKMIRAREMAAGNENLATPAAAAALMRRIAACDLPMSRERCADLRAILEIPKSGSLPRGLPSGTRTAWKPGHVEGVSTAWGIVELPGRPFVVAAMVNYSTEGEGDEAIRRIGEAAWAYFSRLARSTPYGARVPLDIWKEARPPQKRPE